MFSDLAAPLHLLQGNNYAQQAPVVAQGPGCTAASADGVCHTRSITKLAPQLHTILPANLRSPLTIHTPAAGQQLRSAGASSGTRAYLPAGEAQPCQPGCCCPGGPRTQLQTAAEAGVTGSRAVPHHLSGPLHLCAHECHPRGGALPPGIPPEVVPDRHWLQFLQS